MNPLPLFAVPEVTINREIHVVGGKRKDGNEHLSSISQVMCFVCSFYFISGQVANVVSTLEIALVDIIIIHTS